MLRGLKTLGVSLAVVVVGAATLAANALAQSGVLTSTGPVTLKGTQKGEASQNAFTAFGSTVACSSSSFTGHKYATTPHEFILPGAKQATGTPHYSGCTAVLPMGIKPMTVNMRGCDYSLTVGETQEGGKSYALKADIVCPVGQTIDIAVYNNAAHTEGLCTMQIPAQEIPGSVSLSANGGHLDITGGFSGIDISRSGICLLDGKGSTTTQGITDFNLTGVGLNLEGQQTELAISE